MPEIRRLLASYPRTRPPLTAAHEAVYAEEYKKTRGDDKPMMSKVSSGVSGWMHRQVAARARPGAVLEIGAGTLNHLPYEPESVAYDIVEPFTYLYQGHPGQQRLRNTYADIRDVPEDARYARIVSVAVLEHLEELPHCLAKAGKLLEKGGIFQAGIPAEGGLAWGLAWRLTTGLAYRRRTGLDYKTLVRHEHINRADEIVALTRHFFRKVNVRYFPFPPIHASLFLYLEASEPDPAAREAYLERSKP